MSTHLKTMGIVELSPSLREGREVTSGEGRGQASVSRRRKANTGLAAALAVAREMACLHTPKAKRPPYPNRKGIRILEENK